MIEDCCCVVGSNDCLVLVVYVFWRLMVKYDMENFKGDVFGGLVVGIIVLLLVLVFGVQLGLGVVVGFYGVIVVGVFVVVFGGMCI